jgi:Xaa-Pro aminopeptidase
VKAEWARVPWDAEARKKWREIPFAVDEYQARLESLKNLCRDRGFSGCVVHSYGNDNANIQYYTGWTNPYGGHALLVIARDRPGPTLLTSSIVHGEPMHTEIYATWVEDVRCTPVRENARPYPGVDTLEKMLIDALRDANLTNGRVGFTGRFGDAFQGILAAQMKKLAPVSIETEVRSLRAIKSDAEITVMAEAGRICDCSLASGLRAAQPGRTEFDVAGAVAGTMLSEGADGPLYFIQAAAGPRAGFRNVRPTSRQIEQGDFFYLGMGLRYRGYCGRISTGSTIGAPSNEQRRFLEANLEIVDKTMAIAKPGVPAAELSHFATAVGEKLGVERDLWAGGHGLGIHTHEPPFINPESTDILQVGMTFVFEPMLIRTAFGTANAERVYVMTPEGARPLSDLPLRAW